MTDEPPLSDLTVTIENGKVTKIRGADVPPGAIFMPGMADVSFEGTLVTARAIQMTRGLFEFAERSHRKEPAGS